MERVFYYYPTAMKFKRLLLLLLVVCFTISAAIGQAGTSNLVYVDAKGVMKYTETDEEAAFFGVNYTTPFAFSYRAHKALNVDIEKAIEQDVYHMARLGFDAFRVHVWDTEISDTFGNLLQNEHLRLFDFLLATLKKRHIKTIITPIAFWGNGYPEKDEATPGFSTKYGKGRVTVNDTAVKAQENYLRQFFTHVNPYTNTTYGNDTYVIAVELNNEPRHSGTISSVTNYINRLVEAVKSTGFTKPLFYNISENPSYAAAAANANVQGVSFQWYPTGLVANHEVKGNMLPNVDVYAIPFDTIAAFANKAKMVYEFDAADILQSNMYPAMARSFRTAGFQWATQFAYDPMAIAKVNTEYQTHYVNLAYTPSKAISLLIASKAFHAVPRYAKFGAYPADSSFNLFRVSYLNQLSEMNGPREFYYSNSTTTKPLNENILQHIAGVGTSPVVQYNGTGAYFIDKIEEGIWRLEVMPDALQIRDPFEKASPAKEVTRIEWRAQPMRILLANLGQNFKVQALNQGNSAVVTVTANEFLITPGTYMITAANVVAGKTKMPAESNLGLAEFEAPKPTSGEPFVRHNPPFEVTANTFFVINALFAGVTPEHKITVQINNFSGGPNAYATLPMSPGNGYQYTAVVPASMVTAGELSYKIIVEGVDTEYVTFPGNEKGNPYVWDRLADSHYKTFVTTPYSSLEIYNPTIDKFIVTYPNYRRGFTTSYVVGTLHGQLLLRIEIDRLTAGDQMGFQYYFGDKWLGRETKRFNALLVKAAATQPPPLKAKITLTDKNGASWSASVNLLGTIKTFRIPAQQFVLDDGLLLPRPYPGFMPLQFKAAGRPIFSMVNMEKVTITINGNGGEVANKPSGFVIESIGLGK